MPFGYGPTPSVWREKREERADVREQARQPQPQPSEPTLSSTVSKSGLKEAELKRREEQKGKGIGSIIDVVSRVKDKIMGGTPTGDPSAQTKKSWEAAGMAPTGQHKLESQYERLKAKYGEGWTKTSQAQQLANYLSRVPVERGGGLGARDSSYGGSAENIDPTLESRRQDLLNKIAGGLYTQNTLADIFRDQTQDDIGADLTEEQWFNFRQQLMAADPSPGNVAYKEALPWSSGSGLESLSQFVPGIGGLSKFFKSDLPEEYQANIGQAFTVTPSDLDQGGKGITSLDASLSPIYADTGIAGTPVGDVTEIASNQFNIPINTGIFNRKSPIVDLSGYGNYAGMNVGAGAAPNLSDYYKNLGIFQNLYS